MSDYQTLQADIASWLARETLTAQIPTFIRLAEANHRRDLRIQAMMRRARAMGNGNQYLALPDGYLEMRRLRRVVSGDDNPRSGVLEQVTPEAFVARAYGGNPRTYCVHREIELDAPIDAMQELEMVYYAPFAALGPSGTSTNWLLTNAYDAYLYGALAAAEPYLRNDERLPIWVSGYNGAIEALRAEDARGRINRGGQRLRLAGVSTP